MTNVDQAASVLLIAAVVLYAVLAIVAHVTGGEDA